MIEPENENERISSGSIINESKENNSLRKQVEEPQQILLSRKKRWLVFAFMSFINMSVNLDNGSIPAATKEIETELEIDSAQLGLFASLLYFGNLIGSIITMMVMNKLPRKILLIVAMSLNALGLYSFSAIKNVSFSYVNRVLVGVFQSFVTIYCPVWVDQFGPRNRKSVMMALVQIASPLGVVIGYMITSLIKTIDWKHSFIIQACIFGLAAILCLFIDNVYFSTTLECSNPNDPDKPPCAKEEAEIVSVFQHFIKEDNRTKSFWKSLCILIKVKLYMVCISALSVLLFISTAIQFWTSDYLLKILKFDETVIFVAFIVTSITAPTAGILIGGCIVEKFGGYETKNAMIIISFFGLFAFISGTPLPFMTSVAGFATCLWIFLFFGGCVVPNIYGVLISAVPKDLRAPANSVTNFLTHLLGFIPAPYIYGQIFSLTKDSIPNLAYIIIIYYSIGSVILIYIATIIRYKQYKERMKQDQPELEFASPEIKRDKSNHNSNGSSFVQIEKSQNDSNIKSEAMSKLSKQDMLLKHRTGINIKDTTGLTKKEFSEIELTQFNSAPLKHKIEVNKPIQDHAIESKRLIAEEDISYKGENGNSEVFEIKFRKIDHDVFWRKPDTVIKTDYSVELDDNNPNSIDPRDKKD